MSNLSEHVPAWVAEWRRTKDRIATVSITAGGAAVLVAILLIFFYLLYEVLPLFGSATIEQSGTQPWQGAQGPLYVAVEEQGELGLSVHPSGVAEFFSVHSGSVIESESLVSGADQITVAAPESADSRLVAVGYESGQVRLFRHDYRLSYPGGQRVITPAFEWRYNDVELSLLDQPVAQVAVRDTEDALVVVVRAASGELLGQRFSKEEDFLSGEITFEPEQLHLPALPSGQVTFYIGSSQRWLYYLTQEGAYYVVDLHNSDANGTQRVVDTGRLFELNGKLTASELLLGGLSLLAASDEGELVQHFMVREDGDFRLQRIRSFHTDDEVIEKLMPEHRRKGFLALTHSGKLQIFHTTAHRRLLSESVVTLPVQAAAISPRGHSLVLLDQAGQLQHWRIDNEHPDISWSALWSEVWYESYDQPEYIWQSSASNNDFEPKYSFAPLAFGTLKAAFYTMLIAAPLAICGAIYTAYFMAPALRRKVKPLVELMEALPTVILGFLAGLWLAPFLEEQLTGVVTVMLVMPVGVLIFAYVWSQLPPRLRSAVPEGWHAAILIPVIIVIAWSCFSMNDWMELWLFGGDMRHWITNELGISFDQRNALVVGIAMGMAVIPTIFSIAEDSIFSVPKHLSYGSLALGATPWQTLVGVVLPTASPGIFSGLMIGLGRAVGETMIVLMATGNTPIMDANIFEGMRTLSANIAVEVPEAEVDSTHYRVLFLAAFVLFLFTFIVNTIAELVRQRLRVKYGSL
ncbi:MAG: ABC transporter permease subunit [Halioglobus sp.]